MRKYMVAGNWKMNKTFPEAEKLIADILDNIHDNGKPENVDVVLCPPFPYLEMATDMVNEEVVMTGAQNVSQFGKGAYTGEVSAEMLGSLNVTHCIVGHSERRKYFAESDGQLLEKVGKLLENEIIPIFCCGELLEEREANRHFDVVKNQLENTLFKLAESSFIKIIIAYEPVWAIGTGVTASPDQAQEMHQYIRGLISEKFGTTIADGTTILYGGSCNTSNAADLFKNADVDGGLIGGASLKADDFCTIVRSFS
jgi:triosephosphate isomerase